MTTKADKMAHEEAYRARLNEYEIPEGLHYGITTYILYGQAPGDCLQAIFSNDLFDSFGRADEWTTARMANIVRFLWNSAPINCHGSRDRVLNWIEMGGIYGNEKDDDTTQSEDRAGSGGC